MASEKQIKVPKTLGACADRLYAIKQAQSELMKKVSTFDEEAKAIKEHLINELPKNDLQGGVGRQARATIVTKQVPSPKDWDSFYKYVLKTKDFSLLQRRLSEAAIKERWEAGTKVPGVEPFTVVTVSVNKL